MKRGSIAVVAALVTAVVLVVGAATPQVALAAPETFSTPALPEGNARLVDAAVRDLLGRPSTDADHERWTERLDDGSLRRSAFAADVARTPEWTRVVVSDLYVKILGRPAEPAGRDFWADRLVRGQRTADLAADLYASAEFFNAAGGTVEGYVEAVYQNILERAADAEGKAYWVARLGSGSRKPIARSFFLTVESNAKRVDVLYAKLLDRAPDAGGRTYWAQRLVREDDIALAGLLTASQEYFAAAQTRSSGGSATTVAGAVVYVRPALTALTALTIAGDGSGSVTLAAGTALPAGGTPIVASDPTNPPGFALGRVRSVTGRTVAFDAAELDDVFSQLDVSSSVEVPATLGVDPDLATRAVGCKGAFGVGLEPSVTIGQVRPDARLSVGPTGFTTKVVVEVSPDIRLKIASANLSGSCDLASITLQAFVPVGPIPVPVAFGSIGLGVKAQVAWTGLNTTFSSKLRCQAGFEATNTSSRVIRTCAVTELRRPTFAPTAEGTAFVGAFIKPRVGIGFHTGLNVAMYGEVAGFEARGDSARTPWATVDLVADTSIGAEAELGWFNPSWEWATNRVFSQRLWQSTGAAPQPTPLAITTSSLPQGVVGQPYSATLTATGGRGARTWSATGLPAGLSISTAGTITGTPTAPWSGTASASVRDSTGTVTRALGLTVTARTVGRVSRVTTGANGPSTPTISGDGRWLAYSTYVSGASVSSPAIFLLDRTTGAATQVTPSGVLAVESTLSTDGRYLAYTREAGTSPGDTGFLTDVFVYDRVTATTRRITTGDLSSAAPSISGDGRYVTFHSMARNLIAGAPVQGDVRAEVYVWDRSTLRTTRVTNGSESTQYPRISRDGRTIAFSSAVPFVAGDSGRSWDIYTWSTQGGQTTRVTRATESVGYQDAAISADGSTMAFFAHRSPGFVRGPLMLWTATGGVRQVLASGGDIFNRPEVSDDGTQVSFHSEDADLVVGDDNGHQDVFVWDARTSRVRRATDGNDDSHSPSISGDGRFVVFVSAAEDLVPGQSPVYSEVYLWDRDG